MAIVNYFCCRPCHRIYFPHGDVREEKSIQITAASIELILGGYVDHTVIRNRVFSGRNGNRCNVRQIVGIVEPERLVGANRVELAFGLNVQKGIGRVVPGPEADIGLEFCYLRRQHYLLVVPKSASIQASTKTHLHGSETAIL